MPDTPVIDALTFWHPSETGGPWASSCVGPAPLSVEQATALVCARAEGEEAPPRPTGLNRATLTYPILPTADPVEGLRHVRSAYEGCARCHLCSTRMTVVHGRGNPHSAVVFLGEGPGKDENDLGEPFVGGAGKLQDAICSDAGIDPANGVYWFNSVGCRPARHWDTDRPPTEAEQLACSERVYLMLQAIRPRAVICLGKTATRYFFAKPPPVWTYTKFAPAGAPDDWIMVGHGFHPSYLTRVMGVASMYREYAAQRTFYSLLSKQYSSLTKVSAWHFLPQFLATAQEPMTAWHTL